MRKTALFSLLFTTFNDSLGWGIVVTIFPPLLLDPQNRLLPEGTSLGGQLVVLGLLISAYTLIQFIFMPIVGALSDHIGRRIVLNWTTLAASMSFFLTGLAVIYNNLALLFISRMLAGLFAANAATAQAAIAESSGDQTKTKNLALIAIAGGLPGVVGPPLGGLLSSPSFLPGASFSTPFFFIGVLFFLNYILTFISFEETLAKGLRESHGLGAELKNLARLCKIPNISAWLIVAFLFPFGWGLFSLFYPTFLVHQFRFSPLSVGLIACYLSIFWLLTSFLQNRGVGTHIRPEMYFFVGLPILGLLCACLAFTNHLYIWYGVVPLLAVLGSAMWTEMCVLLSNLAGSENQGKIFGINQSLISLAMTVGPIVSGFLATINPGIPLYVAGLILILAGGFYEYRLFLPLEAEQRVGLPDFVAYSLSRIKDPDRGVVGQLAIFPCLLDDFFNLL